MITRYNFVADKPLAVDGSIILPQRVIQFYTRPYAGCEVCNANIAKCTSFAAATA